MSTAKDMVGQAMSCLRAAEHELEADNLVGLSADILRALVAFDARYKAHCDALDVLDDAEVGSTYKDKYGPSIEFYFESDQWHELSVALRQWLHAHPDWQNELNMKAPDGYNA